MTNDEMAAAPALSTHQDETAFEFDQYSHTEQSRNHLSLNDIKDPKELQKAIRSYYSIDETISFIKQHPECRRITLQFPDSLVCDSAMVSDLISSGLDSAHEVESSTKEVCGDSCACSTPPTQGEPQSVWILADTSYSSCCVDEVAAQHVKGNMVIHYGDACLNPVNNVKVGFVFGKPVIDLDAAIKEFQTRFDDKSSKVVLMADSSYTYILEHLYDQLKLQYLNLAYADILQASFPEAEIIGYTPKASDAHLNLFNRSFHGLELEGEETEDVLSEYDLFHITIPEPPKLLKLTTVFQSVTLFDPKENTTSQGPFPNLMKRYRYMHVARNSGTIGLLVNTLSLSNTKTLLNKLKGKITEEGKKYYMFVVGKPNVAKLANFELIDVWCILGCDHQGIIIDQTNEYFKPIITPFELNLALSQELSWTGKWETDFNKLLEMLGDDEPAEPSNDNDEYSDEEPEFNAVTGKYTSASRPLRQRQHLAVTSAAEETTGPSDALVEKFSSEVVIKGTVSTAAVHLQNRHWTGLGSDYVDDEETQKGSLVEEGIKGIARGYEFDINDRQNYSELMWNIDELVKGIIRYHNEATLVSLIIFYVTRLKLLLVLFLVLVGAKLLAIINYRYKVPGDFPGLLADDVVLITGGSKGLGLEMTRELFEKYHVKKVIVLDKVKPSYENCEHIECDVGNKHDLEQALTKVFESCEDNHERISVFINNAGIRNTRSLISLSDEEIVNMYDVNVLSYIWAIRMLVKQYLRFSSHRLSIVAVSSVLGTLAPKNLSLYSSTKAALSQVHEGLAQEFSDFKNVRMLLVVPGQLLTGMFDDVKPSRLFFAPLINHVQLAKDIVRKIDIGECGTISEPLYGSFLPIVKCMPYSWVRLCRWFSEMDEKVKDT